ncbi:MAG: hypothetical protein ABJJ69_15855 [Paracoccaceae bacterium]
MTNQLTDVTPLTNGGIEDDERLLLSIDGNYTIDEQEMAGSVNG